MSNYEFKTVLIKGKEYVTVNERIKYFRLTFPTYSIRTDIIKFDEKICMVKATILDDTDRVLSTAHAYELANNSYINKTSYLENAETSAIGRALGFLGIGIDTSIASADEVENAINQQENNHNTNTDTNTDTNTNNYSKPVKKNSAGKEKKEKIEKIQALKDFSDFLFKSDNINGTTVNLYQRKDDVGNNFRSDFLMSLIGANELDRISVEKLVTVSKKIQEKDKITMEIISGLTKKYIEENK